MRKIAQILVLLIIVSSCCNEKQNESKKDNEIFDNEDLEYLSKGKIEKIEQGIFLNSQLTEELKIIDGNNDLTLKYKHYLSNKYIMDGHGGFDLYIEIPEIDKINTNYNYNIVNEYFETQFNCYSASTRYNNSHIIASNISFTKLDTNEVELFIQLFVKDSIKLRNPVEKPDSIIEPIIYRIEAGIREEIIEVINDTIRIQKHTPANTQYSKKR
ncbi:MAG: hypothetical protein KAT68_14755 [Bacteroidales bacterium]|nr:hypothetical protein [Bacteroidales bacterium]